MNALPQPDSHVGQTVPCPRDHTAFALLLYINTICASNDSIGNTPAPGRCCACCVPHTAMMHTVHVRSPFKVLLRPDKSGQCVRGRQELEDVSQGEARERCRRVADSSSLPEAYVQD